MAFIYPLPIFISLHQSDCKNKAS